MKKELKILLSIVGSICLLLTIDLFCIYALNRPLFAIKRENGSVYRGILYDTYCCEEYSVPQIKMKGSKFACHDKRENKESSYQVSDIPNVSAHVFDISSVGATIVIKDTNETPYTYEEWYVIEKENNGKWSQINIISDDVRFKKIGYLVNDDKEVKFVIDWKNIYGELPVGHYRIIKSVNNQFLAIPFTIEN